MWKSKQTHKPTNKSRLETSTLRVSCPMPLAGPFRTPSSKFGCPRLHWQRQTFSLDLVNYEPTAAADDDVTRARPFDTKKLRSVWGLSKTGSPGCQKMMCEILVTKSRNNPELDSSVHCIHPYMLMCPKYGNIAQTEGGVPNNGYGQTFRPEFHLLYCILSSWAKKGPQL